MAITLSNVSGGARITAAKANQLLQKLEEIRIKHANASGFTTNPAAFNTSYNEVGAAAANTFPQLVKTYVTTLQESKYIASTFAAQIPVPEVGDLIKAVDLYNEDVQVINALDAICANRSNFSDNSNFSDKSDHWNMHNFCSG